jgi:hypothetical protein
MAASVACRPAPIYRGPSQRERVYVRTVSLTGKLTVRLQLAVGAPGADAVGSARNVSRPYVLLAG